MCVCVCARALAQRPFLYVRCPYDWVIHTEPALSKGEFGAAVWHDGFFVIFMSSIAKFRRSRRHLIIANYYYDSKVVESEITRHLWSVIWIATLYFFLWRGRSRFEICCLTEEAVIHLVSKNCAKLLLSELCQMSTNFDNFWQKDGKEAKIMRGALTFHLI